jgi:hypothetical protein
VIEKKMLSNSEAAGRSSNSSLRMEDNDEQETNASEVAGTASSQMNHSQGSKSGASFAYPSKEGEDVESSPSTTTPSLQRMEQDNLHANAKAGQSAQSMKKVTAGSSAPSLSSIDRDPHATKGAQQGSERMEAVERVKTNPKNLEQMEKDVQDKTQARQTSQSMRALSTGHDDRSWSRMDKDLQANAGAQQGSESMRGVERARSNPSTIEQTEKDGQPKSQARQSAHITARLNRPSRLRRTEEDLEEKVEIVKSSPNNLEQMEKDVRAKIQARQSSQSMRALSPGHDRSSLNIIDEDLHARAAPQQGSERMEGVERVKTDPKHLEQMEKDVQAKTQARQSSQSMRALSTGHDDPSCSRLDKDLQPKAGPRQSSESMRGVEGAKSNPSTIEQLEKDVQGESQASQSAQSTRNITSRLNRPSRLRRTEEDLDAKAQAKRGVGKCLSNPLALQQRQKDLHAKARATQGSQSIRNLSGSTQRSSVVRIEENLEAKARAQQSADSMRSASSRSALTRMEEDVEAKARARQGSESTKDIGERPTSLRLNRMEEDLEAKARARQSANSMRSASSRPALTRMEEDVEVKARARQGSESIKDTGERPTSSRLNRMEEDLEAKARARQSAKTSRSASKRALNRMEEDLEAKARARKGSGRIGDSEERSTCLLLNRMGEEFEVKARARQDAESMINSPGDCADRSTLLRLEKELDEKRRSRREAQSLRGAGESPDATALEAREANLIAQTRQRQGDNLHDSSAGGLCAIRLLEQQVVRKGLINENMAYAEVGNSGLQEEEVHSDLRSEEDDYVPHGAFHVGVGGLVETRIPGNLSSQLNLAHQPDQENMADQVGASCVPDESSDASDNEEVRSGAVQNPQGASREQAQEQTRVKAEKYVFSRRNLIIILLIVVLVGVAAAVAISLAGDGGGNNDESTPAPSTDEDRVDDERLALIRDIVEDYVSTEGSLYDKSSPQYAAILWVATDSFSASALDSVSEVSSAFQKLVTRYALAVFYYSLDGDSWFSSSGWLDLELDECNWEYVVCGDEGTIVSIDTGGSMRNLQGLLPSELQEIPSLSEYTRVFQSSELFLACMISFS